MELGMSQGKAPHSSSGVEVLNDDNANGFQSKSIIGLLITEIFLGGLTIVMMAIMMISKECTSPHCHAGYAFYAGVLYCICAVFGCYCFKIRKNKILNIAYTVLTSISIPTSIIPISFGSIDTMRLLIKPGQHMYFVSIFIAVLSILWLICALLSLLFCRNLLCKREGINGKEAEEKPPQDVPVTENKKLIEAK